MTPLPRDLPTIQRWLQAVIMHPDGVVAGISSPDAQAQIPIDATQAEQVIRRSQQLTSIERLQIYGNAYYARLLECLREEFPALRHALGDESFNAFAFGYLQACPSRSYTLGQLGSHFPQFLAETRPPAESAGEAGDWADFLIELARLERTYSEVFDGPGVEDEPLLQAGELSEISPDVWPASRLVVVPCFRLLRFKYPVHEFATAVRQRSPADPPPPDVPLPAPQATWLAITRREFVVRRYPLDPMQYALLEALAAGQPVGDAIMSALEQCDENPDALVGKLGDWFREWTAAPFFARVELPPQD